MSLNISRARVTVTLELEYISSHYINRDHNHITKFFEEMSEMQSRYEALIHNPDDPNYKVIPSSVFRCEYLSNGEWQPGN